MLAGIMRGMQYDSRAMIGVELLRTYGILSRDQQQTHFRRAIRAIVRSSAVQKRTVQAHNTERQAAYKRRVGLGAQTKTPKHALEKGKGVERAYKKSRNATSNVAHHGHSSNELQSQGSGIF
ncbi:hypothetical protein K439DRAFT_1622492 [Ramaria rubella]|nr:hypothetical protein K439DRAFT_1622492 [Ramaria rubella]